MADIDWQKIVKVYFIGIKGSGMAALAELLHKRGVAVSGSDVAEKFFTEESLRLNGIGIIEGFAARNVPSDADLIVYSTAYSAQNNVEMSEAEKLKFSLASYPEVLGSLFNEKIGIAVCGTHGKTTTSAMLATVMRAAGADPAAVIGSRVIDWQSGILAGKGELFVAEADEYQNKLRYYRPFGAILTSVDWDHPDFFPTFEDYKRVFREFVAKIPPHGFLVVWGDGRDVLDITKSARCKLITYGFHSGNTVRVDKIAPGEFKLKYDNYDLGIFTVGLLGDHNILNAAAAVAVCYQLNLDMEKVRESLAGFRGTARRLEYVGERNGAAIFDDYAHHPEEIRTTLKGLREKYPDKNIRVVFHPHTFTRTLALLEEFAQSFDDADEVIVLDIYGSARETQGGVSSQELVKKINQYQSGRAMHIGGLDEARGFLKDRLCPRDVLVTMGAGNVCELSQALK